MVNERNGEKMVNRQVDIQKTTPDLQKEPLRLKVFRVGSATALFLTSTITLSTCERYPTVTVSETPLNETQNPLGTEIAPTNTPEGIYVMSQTYIDQEEILSKDVKISALFSSFQEEIKKDRPEADFSAWGVVANTSEGGSFYAPFFEVSEDGVLKEEYIVRAKSDESDLVILKLEPMVVTAPDGSDYYTLSQVLNTDTFEPLPEPLPIIFVGTPKLDFDLLDEERKLESPIYFNIFGGILPSNYPNLGNFEGTVKEAKLKEVIIPSREIIKDLPEGFLDLYKGVYMDGNLIEVIDLISNERHPALMAGEKVLFINEKDDTPIIFNPELEREKAEKTLSNFFTYFKARLLADRKGITLSKDLDTAIESELLNNLLIEGGIAKLSAHIRSWSDPELATYNFNIPDQYFNLDSETPIILKLVEEPTDNMHFWAALIEDKTHVRGMSLSAQESGTLDISIFNKNVVTALRDPDYKVVDYLAFTFENIFALSNPYSKFPDPIVENTLLRGSDMYSLPPLIMFGKR